VKEDWEKKIADLKKKYGPLDFFSIDAHGRAVDSHIHEPILAAGDHERALNVTRELARRDGWSEEMIERAYGKPLAKGSK
jgi:hypothetical protein